jgi:hypothetical protein
MRSRTVVAALVLSSATVLGTYALAQPRPKPPVTKPKPPAKPDAGEAPSAPNGEPATTSAPPAAETPTPAPEANDGGLRPSPLNPQPQELPSGSLADAGVPVDYDRLLADIAALRARVATLSDNLYQSRIAISVQIEGDHGRVSRLSISLDDGIVFTPKESFAASDMTPVYDHAVAPGRHAVTVDVDRADDRDPSFKTSQRSRFTVDVPRDHHLGVEIRIIDDSAMGADFPSDKSGKYDLRFRVKASAKPAGK